ncbi:MAG: ABC transporter permease [Bauldia sp.]|nr:ABC transporter permease [Bauldia sp.]
MSAEAAAPTGPHFSLAELFRPLVQPIIAVAISVLVGGLLVLTLGENPFEIYWLLISGSLVGWPNFLVTLQMMSPLLFTGLAVAISFRAGLWNIGAEGQMIMGALFAGIAGYAVDLPTFLHIPFCLAAAFLGGLLWALIPAVLRVWLNVNEIVVCLMMNPIALLFSGYVSTHLLKAPGPTNKLPDIAETAMLPTFSLYSQVNAGFIIGLALCLLFAAINGWTKKGFEWKIMGLAPRFAYYGGIRVPMHAVVVMMISGGIAGLGGAEQVLGEYRAFYDNFSPGYGFDGIAVAMLANFNPIGVVLAAFLFGALNGGSAVLQMMTGLSKYLVQVLQFIVVLILAAQFTWGWLRSRKNPITAQEDRLEPETEES